MNQRIDSNDIVFGLFYQTKSGLGVEVSFAKGGSFRCVLMRFERKLCFYINWGDCIPPKMVSEGCKFSMFTRWGGLVVC